MPGKPRLIPGPVAGILVPLVTAGPGISHRLQAASHKQQAPSFKQQAASNKRLTLQVKGLYRTVERINYVKKRFRKNSWRFK